MEQVKNDDAGASPKMTVRRAIELLEAMPDKGLMLMIDCPYCGRGNQLAEIAECVVLKGPKADE
jgi:hypothetical protein